LLNRIKTVKSFLTLAYRKIIGDSIWHMEDILALYEQPYDPLRPVVCFDERPCQLIGEVLAPIPMKPGRIKRQDDEYECQGTCCLFIAFEPWRSWRFVQVRMRRTAIDYASFMQELVETHYWGIEQIRLVQDNVPTHTPGVFYHALAPQEAFELAQKFDLHYTPIKGSWLNMAESELSALARQCLDRRIGDIIPSLAWAIARISLAWVLDKGKFVTVHSQ
jgi:hypothetical protein